MTWAFTKKKKKKKKKQDMSNKKQKCNIINTANEYYHISE